MNKNDFLRAGIAMLATPTLPDVVPVSVRKEFKITNIRAYVFNNAAFVEIETDAGVSGWGEGDHEFTPINGKIVGEILKTRLLGQDPFDFVPCVKQWAIRSIFLWISTMAPPPNEPSNWA